MIIVTLFCLACVLLIPKPPFPEVEGSISFTRLVKIYNIYIDRQIEQFFANFSPFAHRTWWGTQMFGEASFFLQKQNLFIRISLRRFLMTPRFLLGFKNLLYGVRAIGGQNTKTEGLAVLLVPCQSPTKSQVLPALFYAILGCFLKNLYHM